MSESCFRWLNPVPPFRESVIWYQERLAVARLAVERQDYEEFTQVINDVWWTWGSWFPGDASVPSDLEWLNRAIKELYGIVDDSENFPETLPLSRCFDDIMSIFRRLEAVDG